MQSERQHDSERLSAPADQLRLRTGLNRWLSARTAARRSGRADDAQELQAARVALVRLLQEAGWDPPPALRAALHDEADDGHRRSA